MIPIHAPRVAHAGRKFEVFRCGLCGITLRCPKCGNNACNSGYGEIDGVTCDVCPLTYDAQNAHGRLLAWLEAASGTSGSAQDPQGLDPKGAGPAPKGDAQ